MACRAMCLYTIFVLLSFCLAVNAVANPHRIYDVSLQNNWQDWSYTTTIDTETTSGSYTVISAQLSLNAGLYLHYAGATPVTRSSWWGVEMSILFPVSAHKLMVTIHTEASGSSGYSTQTYDPTGSVAANTWYTLSIPWTDFTLSGTTITGIEVQTFPSQASQNSFSNDNDATRTVQFRYIYIKPSSTYTYTPYSYVAPASQTGALIFDTTANGLQACWNDWSAAWVGAANYQVTGSGFQFYPKNDFKGIYFSSPLSFDGNAMLTLSYKLYPYTGARRNLPVTQYKVVLFDNSATPQPIGDGYIVRSLGNYNQWNTVSHSMSIFNIPSQAKISGVAFMGTKYAQSGNDVLLKFDAIKLGTPGAALSCSSLNSDPIIRGFDGEIYDFKGVPDRIFNILSMPDLQINSYFIAGLGDNETYSGAIGIKQGDASFISFDLNTASLHDPNTTAIAKHLAFPLTNFALPNGGLVSRPRPGTLNIQWPFYTIEMKRMFEMRNGVEFNYIDLGVTINIDNLKQGEIHGALGQTYHRNGVMGGGSYDGVWEDYAAARSDTDIFTDDFPQKYFRYNPSHTPKYIAGYTTKAAATGK